MIFGAHSIIFSSAPEETRKLLAKILRSRTVDAGGGWPIFALPPGEVAVHPTDGNSFHELYLMCDDLEETVAKLRKDGVEVSATIHEETWGKMTTIPLPGGGTLRLYQPFHPMAIAKAATGRSVARRRKSARSTVKRSKSRRKPAGGKSKGR